MPENGRGRADSEERRAEMVVERETCASHQDSCGDIRNGKTSG